MGNRFLLLSVGVSSVKASAVTQLAKLLAKEDCQLLSLCVEDSHLKELTSVLLEAVIEGTNLVALSLRYASQPLCSDILSLACCQWEPDGTERSSLPG